MSACCSNFPQCDCFRSTCPSPRMVIDIDPCRDIPNRITDLAHHLAEVHGMEVAAAREYIVSLINEVQPLSVSFLESVEVLSKLKIEANERARSNQIKLERAEERQRNEQWKNRQRYHNKR